MSKAAELDGDWEFKTDKPRTRETKENDAV